MSTYAIIKTGGKQVKVEVGQAVYVEKLNVEAGQEVTFNEVVLVGGENTVVGTPLVAGATVVGTVEKQGKQKKVEPHGVLQFMTNSWLAQQIAIN